MHTIHTHYYCTMHINTHTIGVQCTLSFLQCVLKLRGTSCIFVNNKPLIELKSFILFAAVYIAHSFLHVGYS